MEYNPYRIFDAAVAAAVNKERAARRHAVYKKQTVPDYYGTSVLELLYQFRCNIIAASVDNVRTITGGGLHFFAATCKLHSDRYSVAGELKPNYAFTYWGGSRYVCILVAPMAGRQVRMIYAPTAGGDEGRDKKGRVEIIYQDGDLIKKTGPRA